MAYFTQEQKAKMAPKVKLICKKYGVNASLSVYNHSVVVLKIKAASIDFINNYNEVLSHDFYRTAAGQGPATGTLSLNPHHYSSAFTGQCLACLNELFDTLNEGNHDNSDIQSDYFDVGWYVDVNIGSWNKPFNLI